MSTVEAIERAVRALSPEELALFRAWFAEFDAGVWDRQIEADVAAGRLDVLAEEALKDLHEGGFTPARSPLSTKGTCSDFWIGSHADYDKLLARR